MLDIIQSGVEWVQQHGIKEKKIRQKIERTAAAKFKTGWIDQTLCLNARSLLVSDPFWQCHHSKLNRYNNKNMNEKQKNWKRIETNFYVVRETRSVQCNTYCETHGSLFEINAIEQRYWANNVYCIYVYSTTAQIQQMCFDVCLYAMHGYRHTLQMLGNLQHIFWSFCLQN